MTRTSNDHAHLPLTVSPAGTPITAAVVAAAQDLAGHDALPGYLYDLDHLSAHLADVRAAFASAAAPVELLHAVKANPDPGLLGVIAEHVDGLEVASGGELAHVREHLPQVPLAFGGPGKTDTELASAVHAGVGRFHVESLHELRRLNAVAREAGRVAQVLLRVNIPAGSLQNDMPALTMGGVPSPFGMDPGEADVAATELAGMPAVRMTGIHAHLASGLEPAECVGQAETVLTWSADFARRHRLPLREVNVGGGMAVDYNCPQKTFDWAGYARGMARLVETAQPEFTDPIIVRIEPGRAISAYSGWYATEVLDLKRSHGSWFAVCAGGTHHLRTPVAKGHNQPLAVVPAAEWDRPWARQEVTGEPVTFVGQLCTPKDVLARDVFLPRLSIGDLVIFAMAGAYAYNISHRDFLLHPAPTVVHLGGR